MRCGIMEFNKINQKILKNNIHEFIRQQNINEKSKKEYYSHIKTFIRKYDDSLSPTVNYNKQLKQWKKEYSHNYMVTKTMLIRKFFEYLGEQTTEMDTFKRVPDKRNYLPKETINTLLKCNSGRPLQEMIVLLSTGLRCGDVARLRYDDVNYEERCLIVREPKGAVPYIVPLSDSILDYLQYELKDFNEGRPFLWYGQRTNKPISMRTIELDINKAGRLIKMHNLCPTNFRHTYLTLLIELGMDPICADMCIGHSQKGHVSSIYNHNLEPSFAEIQQEFDNVSKKFDKILFGKNTEVPKQAKLNTLDSLFQ